MDWDQFKFTPTLLKIGLLWNLSCVKKDPCSRLAPPTAGYYLPQRLPRPPHPTCQTAQQPRCKAAPRAFMALFAASFQQSLMLHWRTLKLYCLKQWKNIFTIEVCVAVHINNKHEDHLFISPGPFDPVPQIQHAAWLKKRWRAWQGIVLIRPS